VHSGDPDRQNWLQTHPNQDRGAGSSPSVRAIDRIATSCSVRKQLHGRVCHKNVLQSAEVARCCSMESPICRCTYRWLLRVIREPLPRRRAARSPVDVRSLSATHQASNAGRREPA
jgi:hypothetical protein